jgi:hypothetical protein
LAQRGISVGRAWTVTKLLHIHPYKITFVPKIKPMDYGKTVKFCKWFINHLRKLSEHYAVFGELNAYDRITSYGL